MSFNVSGFGAMMQAFDEIEDSMVVQNSYSIGTNVRYAPFQEFGTSYQSGTPHLRPGFDQALAEFEQISATSETASQTLQRLALEVERQTKQNAPVDTGHLKNSYRAERF